MQKLDGTRVVIVTHRSLMPDIPGGDLKKFMLKTGVSELIYITHPLLLLKESYKLSSQIEYFENSQLKKNLKAYHFILPESFSYIKDFIYTIYWVFMKNRTFDLYFGINNMNALAGLILKKAGRVKKVVYYTIDLYPERFSNKFLNFIYHEIDKICVSFCDETWNVSPYISRWRARRWEKKRSSKEFTVPIGIWFDEIKRVPAKKVNLSKIVYVGHLKNFYGVELIIRALPLIRKRIPNVKLNIIGGGEQLKELQQLMNILLVKDNINFLGWKEKKLSEKLMADSALGFAPFNTAIIDEKIKNSDPAKIKDYLALGIPVVMTNATVNAKAISKAKCGIIIEYSPEALANTVLMFLTNRTLLIRYRQNALRYVNQFDWNKLFSTNLSRL